MNLPALTQVLEDAAQLILDASSCLVVKDDGFFAADFLLDRTDDGQGPLAGKPVPDEVWTELIRALDVTRLRPVAVAAVRADRADLAQAAWRRAANGGDQDAMLDLGLALLPTSTPDSEAWIRKAAEAGHPESMANLAAVLEQQGQHQDAEQWYMAAIEAEVRAVKTAPADYGKVEFRRLPTALYSRGQVDYAVRVWQVAAQRYGAAASDREAVRLAEEGRLDEALAVLHNPRHPLWMERTDIDWSIDRLPELLHEHGRHDDAVRVREDILKRYGSSRWRVLDLARSLLQAQRHDDLLTLLRSAVSADDTETLQFFAAYLRRGEHVERADQLDWFAEQADFSHGQRMAAPRPRTNEELESRGALDEAVEALRDIQRIDPTARRSLAELLETRGDTKDAEELWVAMTTDGPGAKAGLARFYERQHRLTEAERLWRSLTDANLSNPLPEALGKVFGLTFGSSRRWSGLAQNLQMQGRTREAEDAWTRAVDEGEGDGSFAFMLGSARFGLYQFLLEQDRPDDAERLRRESHAAGHDEIDEQIEFEAGMDAMYDRGESASIPTSPPRRVRLLRLARRMWRKLWRTSGCGEAAQERCSSRPAYIPHLPRAGRRPQGRGHPSR